MYRMRLVGTDMFQVVALYSVLVSAHFVTTAGRCTLSDCYFGLLCLEWSSMPESKTAYLRNMRHKFGGTRPVTCGVEAPRRWNAQLCCVFWWFSGCTRVLYLAWDVCIWFPFMPKREFSNTSIEDGIPKRFPSLELLSGQLLSFSSPGTGGSLRYVFIGW